MPQDLLMLIILVALVGLSFLYVAGLGKL